ncbi:MAG: hypothetical protein KJZ87_15265 [Thermoguttaceae bacterium]|nr:hypothetical protein [Thermoguttaceae bacterium]
MTSGDKKPKPALGFFTVIEQPECGLFGGYLVLNLAGRPLEFQCTTPIRPSRAQQILFGPTLEPYLFGEQIGQTLLGKSRIRPLLVCTDRRPALAVREFVDFPVVLVLPKDLNSTSPETSDPKEGGRAVWRIDDAHPGNEPLMAFTWGRNRLAVAQSADEDRQRVATNMADWDDAFDLAEPFGRIREAIEEARRGGQ